ncbi:hypothetical protein SESBI_33636 [Sesbania bispinosa]|nr:hypothetical protein SESBI_33636 [Sesbania bispinosa]
MKIKSVPEERVDNGGPSQQAKCNNGGPSQEAEFVENMAATAHVEDFAQKIVMKLLRTWLPLPLHMTLMKTT